jgi:alkanesulfonate monooxygenase
MTGERVSFAGRHIRFEGAQLHVQGVQSPHPELFFGGSSPAGLAMAAKQVQTYLTWGEPPAQAAEKIGAVRVLASARGRTLNYGIRLHLIVRDTKEEAWAAVQRIYDRFDQEQIQLALKVRATSDSVGVQRMTALVNGKITKNARDLEISPDLWAGYTLTGKGPGTALVGDPETVAERLLEYYHAGFDTFILSGQPQLEEAYRVAEKIFPLLPFNVENSRRRNESLRTLRNLAAVVS